MMRSKCMTLAALVLLPMITGCTSYQIGTAMSKHDTATEQIKLGDSKDMVLTILKPTQQTLTRKQRKQPDRYMKDNILVEVYYFRSGWQSDGLTTDDEFTPYIFHNEKLVGIGWAMIGGPKTQGQASDTINIRQKTVVY